MTEGPKDSRCGGPGAHFGPLAGPLAPLLGPHRTLAHFLSDKEGRERGKHEGRQQRYTGRGGHGGVDMGEMSFGIGILGRPFSSKKKSIFFWQSLAQPSRSVSGWDHFRQGTAWPKWNCQDVPVDLQDGGSYMQSLPSQNMSSKSPSGGQCNQNETSSDRHHPLHLLVCWFKSGRPASHGIVTMLVSEDGPNESEEKRA